MAVSRARKVAVCLPALNELPSLLILIPEIDEVVRRELLGEVSVYLFDDGSTDGTYEELVSRAYPGISLVVLRSSVRLGKAVALSHLFRKALKEKSNFLVMMDADCQDDPQYIPEILELLEAGADVVNARRSNRAHHGAKRLSSRLFNGFVRTITGVKLWDINSGFKGFSRRGAKVLMPYFYGELHRSILIIAAWVGLAIDEVKVVNRPRSHGESKYGFARSWRGLFDLVTVQFLRRYHNRPGHFFSGVGALLILIGLAFLVPGLIVGAGGSLDGWLAYLPWAGLSSIAFGVITIGLGFLAELMLFLSKRPVTTVIRTNKLGN